MLTHNSPDTASAAQPADNITVKGLRTARVTVLKALVGLCSDGILLLPPAAAAAVCAAALRAAGAAIAGRLFACCFP
jgi:hypothetical protein